MEERVTVRKAIEEDVPALVELWIEMMDLHRELDLFFSRTATGHERWAELVTGHMSKEKSCVFVAECRGRVAGYCAAFIEENPAVIETVQYGSFQELSVSSKYRRRGVGAELVKAMLQWFRERKIERVEVRVAVHNELSTAFWRKMGFRPYLETLCCET